MAAVYVGAVKRLSQFCKREAVVVLCKRPARQPRRRHRSPSECVCRRLLVDGGTRPGPNKSPTPPPGLHRQREPACPYMLAAGGRSAGAIQARCAQSHGCRCASAANAPHPVVSPHWGWSAGGGRVISAAVTASIAALSKTSCVRGRPRSPGTRPHPGVGFQVQAHSVTLLK